MSAEVAEARLALAREAVKDDPNEEEVESLQAFIHESTAELEAERAAYVACPVPGTQRSASLPVSAQEDVPTQEEAAEILQALLPSPPVLAGGHRCDSQLARLLLLMRARQPVQLEAEPFHQLPVSLMDRILAQVEEDCACAAPSAQDAGFAQHLIFALSDSIGDEEACLEKFCELASSEFGIHFRRMTDPMSEAGGSAAVQASQVVSLGAALQVKGSGGRDPAAQDPCYTAVYGSDGLQKPLRALCRCPTLLIELSGHNLSLSGFAVGQYACCDQLAQPVSLVWQPRSQIMLAIPRAVYAIRRAWPALQEYYQELCKGPVPLQEDPQLAFPYPRTFTSSGGMPVRFTYLERLTDHTFHAVADGSAEGSAPETQSPPCAHIFIKFCKRYCLDGHMALQRAGFAPRLLGCERLPGPWLMVVTEFLSSACTWDAAMQKPRDALRAAVTSLHAAGFVHGDLRACNVLVDHNQVHLTDLEWAGEVGQAKYPLYMNHDDIAWPPGATDNEPMLVEHDLYWMNRLLAD